MSKPDATPGIFEMHDYTNLDPADFPAWGPVGSWMWWPWSGLEPAKGAYAWPVIDNYLTVASALGKPVALSVIPYPGPNQDTTPKWVYGGGRGWEGTNSAGQTFTYPAYNSVAWDTAFRDMIHAMGARFDGDPRVHSVWLATLLYGETVITQPDGGELGHNPVRFVLNAIDWYSEAFPTTPLFILCTGTTDRRAIAEYALARGVDLKFNGLVRDAGNHHMIKPVPDAGIIDVSHIAMARGRPTAWEHAYNLTSQGETYWAMLTGLANGMEVLDLPIEGLQTLASIPGLWEWVLRIMSYPRDQVAMWVARDTRYPAPGNGWEHGWPGPWVRGDIGINAGAQVGAPGSDLFHSASGALTNSLYGYGGIARLPGEDLTVAVTMPPGNYDVEVITGQTEWQTSRQIVYLDGNENYLFFSGNRWVHRVVVTPSDDEPPPPPPPPPDLTELAAKVEALTASQATLLDDLSKQAAAITDLDRATARLLERLGAVDAKLAGVRDALN